MTYRFLLQHLLALVSLLSYQTISFVAADAVQDPGNDGWYGLAPIDVNPQIPANPRLPQPKYVNFGNSFFITADGQTITATSQEWVGPNTDDLAVQKTTITSDGNPVTTTVTQYAQFVETTVTKEGKPAVATNLVVTPKILSILDSVRAEALSSCHKKAKRQACDLKTIGPTILEDLVRKWASREGVILGTKVVTALVGIHLLGALSKTQFNGNGAVQYAQPLFTPVLDIPSLTITTSSSSTEPAITAWTDPQYQDIDAILALSITADSPKPTTDTSPSLFCSKTANPPATIIVDRAPAISHGAQFCHDTANSTYGLGQDYNGTNEEYGSFTYYERWADTDNCKDDSISYTIDEQKCGLYINMTIDACDPPAPDNYNAKHGGTVTDGCMVFEMRPRIVESVAPTSSTSAPTTTDPPPPAPTKPCPVSCSSPPSPLPPYTPP